MKYVRYSATLLLISISTHQTLLNGTDWPGDGEHIGEAKSPLDGEFRLLADHRLARSGTLALPIEHADNALQEIQGPHAIGNLSSVRLAF